MNAPSTHINALIELGRLCALHHISNPTEKDLLELVVAIAMKDDGVLNEINRITNDHQLMGYYRSVHAVAQQFMAGTAEIGSATGLNQAESHLVLVLAEMVELDCDPKSDWLNIVRYARQCLMPPVRVIGQLSRALTGCLASIDLYSERYRYMRPSHWWWERQYFADGSEAVLPVAAKYPYSRSMKLGVIADAHRYGHKTLVTCTPYANCNDMYLVDASDDVKLLKQIQSPLPYCRDFRRLVISQITKYCPKDFVDNAQNLGQLSISEWLRIIKERPERHDAFLRQSKNQSRNIAIYLLSSIGKISRAKFDGVMGKLHSSRNKRCAAREAYRLLKSFYPECHADKNTRPVMVDVVGMRKGLAAEFKRMGLY